MIRPVSALTTALVLLAASGLGGCGTTHPTAPVPSSFRCELPA
jgi:hypothetical protein